MATGDYLSVLSHGLIVTDGAAGDCDYPVEADVRDGVVYGDGAFTGTLVAAGSLSPDQDAYSPADVLRNLMITMGLGTDPESAASWPVFTAQEPTSPDNCITTYDTTGQSDGRFQVNGELYDHFGVQVRIRASNHAQGWIKSQSIRDRLANEVFHETVTLGGLNYRVHGCHKIGQVLALGKESAVSRRSLFTINLFITLRLCE